MADARAQLVTRKEDLLAALRLLERDHRDGVVDEAAYRIARRRYEQEAAEVLERLDAVLPEQRGAVERSTVSPFGLPFPTPLAGGAAALVLVAVVLFLVAAVRPRVGGQSITGDAGQASSVPTPTARLLAAERAVVSHPRSVRALIDLGNAYLESGQAAEADRSYQAAMKLDPADPRAKTLHAMLLGSTGADASALALLHQVERAHPTYSRAWLLDGVLSARTAKGYAHAIRAWQRFLVLEPNGDISRQVRGWIARTKQAQQVKK